MSVTFGASKQVNDPRHGFIWITVVDGPNLSNRNACLVLESLGYEEDAYLPGDGGVYGELELKELKGRLLLAHTFGALRPDDGVPSVKVEGRRTVADDGSIEAGPTLIECGLRPEYFKEKYEQLLELVDRTEAAGLDRVSFA